MEYEHCKLIHNMSIKQVFQAPDWDEDVPTEKLSSLLKVNKKSGNKLSNEAVIPKSDNFLTIKKNIKDKARIKPEVSSILSSNQFKNKNETTNTQTKKRKRNKKNTNENNTNAYTDGQQKINYVVNPNRLESIKNHNKSNGVLNIQKKTKEIDHEEKSYISPKTKKKLQIKSLLETVNNHNENRNSIKKGNALHVDALHVRMMDKLRAARFRFLNEKLYLSEGKDAKELFKNDPNSFAVYHDGYSQQLKKWPLNPLSVVIKQVSKMPKDTKIADLGCGNGTLAKSVKQKVRSFDLQSIDPVVEECDMAHTPLLSAEMDVVVFCLSLMGTNMKDYIIEANRILKTGGTMKIAEVESRFQDVKTFIKEVEKFGFSLTKNDFSNNLFYFMDFKKQRDTGKRNKLPYLNLKPCLYKKR